MTPEAITAAALIAVFLAGFLIGQIDAWQNWAHRRRVTRLRARREQDA